ncbi:MAG: glycosyltransferase family 2 protein, partial [Xanthomonadales bacterium]|nr:glycosyltransferase family 2 protein [Xanthomonadales bacterium]
MAIVATVKAPLDLLIRWVTHHRNLGFERFFLFFDDPMDAAIGPMSSLEHVTATRCGAEWWKGQDGSRPVHLVARQLINLEQGIEAARAAGIRWVAHIDADELVRPISPLAEVLNENRADALRMDVREAISERMEYAHIFESRTFRIPPGRMRLWVARLLGCRQSIRHGEYFRGHTESKSLVRLDGRVRRMGVHKPQDCEEGVRIDWTTEIQLLHFDCVGFADWDSKWNARVNGNSFGRGMRPARQAQFEAYAKAARRGLEARRELFRATQMIRPREATVLR